MDPENFLTQCSSFYNCLEDEISAEPELKKRGGFYTESIFMHIDLSGEPTTSVNKLLAAWNRMHGVVKRFIRLDNQSKSAFAFASRADRREAELAESQFFQTMHYYLGRYHSNHLDMLGCCHLYKTDRDRLCLDAGKDTRMHRIQTVYESIRHLYE